MTCTTIRHCYSGRTFVITAAAKGKSSTATLSVMSKESPISLRRLCPFSLGLGGRHILAQATKLDTGIISSSSSHPAAIVQADEQKDSVAVGSV